VCLCVVYVCLFVCLFAKYSNLILRHSVDGVGAEFRSVNKAPDDAINSLEYFELSVDNMKTVKLLTDIYVI
jgi:hypothetical protein